MNGDRRKDLYILTADLDMEATMKELLNRHQSLQIREISFEVGRHLEHDPGCRRGAVEFLRPMLDGFDYAIVMFDRCGCGDSATREEVQRAVAGELERNGWYGRSSVVVIDPFLESWVWNGSDEVPRVLGVPGDFRRVRLELEKDELWSRQSAKPLNPKQAMKRVLRRSKTRHSSTIFGDLAGKVSLTGCADPAFADLVSTLRGWFPRQRTH